MILERCIRTDHSKLRNGLRGSDSGSSKAVINLDVGKGVKLKGAAAGDGSASGGIFFEKEY